MSDNANGASAEPGRQLRRSRAARIAELEAEIERLKAEQIAAWWDAAAEIKRRGAGI